MVAVAAALGAFVLGTGTVSAATELKTSGNIGQYSVSDAQGDVICSYDQSGYLEAIYIDTPPEVYARNKTSGLDQQQVGWQFIVKSRLTGPDQTYTPFFKSTVAKANATDASAAAFEPRKLAVAFPDDFAYRVFVKVIWYRADNSIAGTTKTRIDTYTVNSPVFGEVFPNEGCGGVGV